MVGKTLAMPEPKHGHLVIISRSGGDGKAFPMHNSRVLIGRKETCDIRMQRPEVSKEHCVIRIADGAVVLKNLSENGTSVNDHALAAGQQHTLKTGDVITIVGRSLRYEQPRPGSSTLQTPPQPLRRLASLHRPQSEVISRPHIRREPISNALFTGRRMPRDPEVARKFRAWDAHYADDDDPFSASAESAASTSAFQRMAASVQRFNSAGATCSPLKRTVSNGGPLLHTPTDTGGDSSDEVPTEPEPESESEQEPDPVRAQPVQHVQRTPSIRRILMTDMSSAARKSVRFGPPLSPEVFDTQAPPSTPLRRGTPMQMARVSSILRQSSERLLSAESALPVPASNDNSKVETDEEDEEKEKIHEPIKEIESPVALGSPEDRRNRRRRSLRAVRRATLEPRALETSPSPSLVVRTRAAANDLTPSRLFQADASTAQSRTERRRTAPESLSATLAEMAAALGEDVPAAFKKPEVPLPEPEREHEEEADEEKEEEKKEHVPLPTTTEQPLGLAEAMHMLESPTKAAEISPPLPLQAPEAAELTEQLLREQAELQARFGLVSVDVGPRQRAAAERRQTTTLEHLRAVAELESDDEAEVMPEVGTHRERLRRQQERKRRRQTIAALKQRRSSWRGWTASVPELLSSPPQSPTGHMPASPSPVPTTADTAVNSADAPSFSLLPICPASASAMYPPPAWNHAADSKSFDRSQPTTSSSPDRMLPTRRRLTDTNHAYPPRPLPIDAGWELVDNRDMPDKPDHHDTFESDVGQPSSELHSQSVDLHAVPVPITDALGNRDTLSESADPALGPIIVQPPPVFSPPRTRSATTLKSSLASSRAGSTTSLNPKKATLPKPKAIAAPKAKAATIPNTKAKTSKSKTAAAPSKPGPATTSKPKTAAEREINSPAPSDSTDTSLVGGHALRSAPRKRKADKPAPKPAQPKRTRAQPKPASPPHTRSSKRTKRP